MKAVTIRRFSTQDSNDWNHFVKSAKNATFLFDRNYMDYHSDRFKDHSAMVFEGETLRAILPAHEDGNQIVSHGGLTYGGLLLPQDIQLDETLRFFFHLFNYYHALGFESMIYKCIPQHYCTYPSYEDHYAMFVLQGKLIRRDTSCVFSQSTPLPYQHRRVRMIKKAKQLGCEIVKSNDPEFFWAQVLNPNLKDRFNATPVHSIDEIRFLMGQFPNNIHLYEIHGTGILGGTLLFESAKVVHAQYISATPIGKEHGALDLLFDRLLNLIFTKKEFFSLGTSNGSDGQILNTSLLSWKEGFGARVHTLDTYEVQTANFEKLQAYA